MKFGDRLKQLRLNRNMTQSQLGKEIGVLGRVVGYYESGDRFPNEDVLKNIANYFDVSVDYLLGMDIDFNLTIYDDLENILNRLSSDEEVLFKDNKLDDKERKILVDSIENLINIVDTLHSDK